MKLADSKQYFKTIGVLVLIASLNYYYAFFSYYYESHEVREEPSRKKIALAPKPSAAKSVSKADEYCSDPELNEWEELDGRFFFKKSASFCFLDVKLIRTHVVFREEKNLSSFRFHLTIQTHDSPPKNFVHIIEDTKFGWPNYFANYGSTHLDAEFDLWKTLQRYQVDAESVSIQLIIENKRNGQKTKRPVKLDLKYASKTATLIRKGIKSLKNGSFKILLCEKCLFLADNEYKDFRWWLEANRKIGYDKIVLCNQSIENSDNMNRVFAEYKDFVEITHIHCLPNFISNSSEGIYLKNFTELKFNGAYHDYITDKFQMVADNECYLKNMDKYDYIAIHDNDELIIPMVSEKAPTLSENRQLISELDVDSPEAVSEIFQDKCNLYQDSNIGETSYMSGFIKHLITANNLSSELSSIQFYQAQYLKSEIFDNIFNQLGKYLNTLNITSELMQSTFKKHAVVIIDKKAAGKKNHDPFNHTITISSPSELAYAVKLVKLYQNHVRPFMIKQKSLLSNISGGQFDRVFVYHFDRLPLGKTIHNTNRSFEVSQHYHLTHMRPTGERLVNRLPTYQIFDGSDAKFQQIPENQGQIGHFRYKLKFNPKSIRISQLHFDLNYFNCFFMPIFKKFQLES